MINSSLRRLVLNFHKYMQYIDLMQIVQVWKAVTIVTSVCLNLSTILVVSHL